MIEMKCVRNINNRALENWHNIFLPDCTSLCGIIGRLYRQGMVWSDFSSVSAISTSWGLVGFFHQSRLYRQVMVWLAFFVSLGYTGKLWFGCLFHQSRLYRQAVVWLAFLQQSRLYRQVMVWLAFPSVSAIPASYSQSAPRTPLPPFVLRTQKSRPFLVRNQLSEVLLSKLWVGQNIALHASPTAGNSDFSVLRSRLIQLHSLLVLLGPALGYRGWGN